MLKEIKKELLNAPDKIREVLEYFNYCNIVIRSRYMQFGRDAESSSKSIVIRLVNNDWLYVTDYPRNIHCDLFSYISSQRKCEFIDVLNVVKEVLGINDYYDFFNSKVIFGGFYDSIRKHISGELVIYDEAILSGYERCGNLRFLKDNISLETQKYFRVGYDIESQCITIPIYDQFGQLTGVKARVNQDVLEGDIKYYYLFPCQMSQTLYGYSHNYEYLSENAVLIFESEKSVMQCHTYGIRNCVALGSSSISQKQIKMLIELHPRQVIFMYDEGLDIEDIKRNIDMFTSYSRRFELPVGYWDTSLDIDIPHKASASDLGREKLYEILETQIVWNGRERDREKL